MLPFWVRYPILYRTIYILWNMYGFLNGNNDKPTHVSWRSLFTFFLSFFIFFLLFISSLALLLAHKKCIWTIYKMWRKGGKWRHISFMVPDRLVCHRKSDWQTLSNGWLLSASSRFHGRIILPVSNVFVHSLYSSWGVEISHVPYLNSIMVRKHDILSTLTGNWSGFKVS